MIQRFLSRKCRRMRYLDEGNRENESEACTHSRGLEAHAPPAGPAPSPSKAWRSPMKASPQVDGVLLALPFRQSTTHQTPRKKGRVLQAGSCDIEAPPRQWVKQLNFNLDVQTPAQFPCLLGRSGWEMNITQVACHGQRGHEGAQKNPKC